MFEWPQLELTDYERKFVRVYKEKVGDKVYPGVLRRSYERVISNNASIAALPGLTPGAQLQIARRARIFGLTFSGGLSATRLQITNASGTLYNVSDPRTGNYPYVTSMLGSSPYMQGSRIGRKLAPALQGTNLAPVANPQVFLSGEASDLLIDPNWVLLPNETLIFNGNWDDLGAQPPTIVLRITIHVWEFPGMGRADAEHRQVL